MQTIYNLLSINISYQKNTWSEINEEKSLESILDSIKSTKYKSLIDNLRVNLENGNKEFYDNYKKHLPAVTFSATFQTKRTKENLKNYNSLIVIDIDKLNKDEMERVYQYLINDKYVLAFWRSPSNKGFKGLISLNFDFEKSEFNLDLLHKSAFKKISEYFSDNYKIELDQSGSDYTRLCFLSYDNGLILKKQYEVFQITDGDLIKLEKSKIDQNYVKLKLTSSRDSLYNPLDRNNPKDRKIMSDIIRFLTKKKLSITYDYADWCKVSMAISNAFTYDIGIKYFLKLSSLDLNKYNEATCTNFLNNCYETRTGNVRFNSIVYLANQKGYKTKYQRNGVPKVEN